MPSKVRQNIFLKKGLSHVLCHLKAPTPKIAFFGVHFNGQIPNRQKEGGYFAKKGGNAEKGAT